MSRSQKAAVSTIAAEIEAMLAATKKASGGHEALLSEDSAPVEFVSTGVWSLDRILGGGIPLGRIVELFGPDSTGKTTLALSCAKSFIDAGGFAVYADAECALVPDWVSALGVDTKSLIRVFPETFEDMLASIHEKIVHAATEKLKGPILIVADTFTAAVCAADVEKSIRDNAKVGNRALLTSRGLGKLLGPLYNSRCALLILNQVRENVGAGLYMPKTASTGGRAVRHYASIRVELSGSSPVKTKSGDVIGTNVTVRVPKNKVAPARGACAYRILSKGGALGIDNHFAAFVDLLATGHATKSRNGSVTALGQDFASLNDWRAALAADAKYREAVRAEVVKQIPVDGEGVEAE